MADHLRAAIRAAVVTLLRAAAPYGTRVFATRRMPLQAEHLPALLVYTLSEDSAVETMTPPRFLSRDLDLVIECVAQDNDALDGTLDGMAVTVETAMATALDDPSSPLRALARAGSLSRTEIGMRPPQAPDEAGTGHAVLTFRVNYRTRGNNPTSNI
jgi:hypothetical protein